MEGGNKRKFIEKSVLFEGEIENKVKKANRKTFQFGLFYSFYNYPNFRSTLHSLPHIRSKNKNIPNLVISIDINHSSPPSSSCS